MHGILDLSHEIFADHANEGPLISQINQALLFEIKNTRQIRSWHRLQNSPPFLRIQVLANNQTKGLERG